MKTIRCTTCRKSLHRSPSLTHDRNFCDQRCYGRWRETAFVGASNPKWRGGSITKVCPSCHREFTVGHAWTSRRYCSVRCKVLGTTIIRTCRICGRGFTGNNRTCSRACGEKALRLPRGVPSEETRDKIGIANTGKPGLRGAKNPMWKGGVAPDPYSPGFTGALKRLVMRRDRNKCRGCGGRGPRLVVHHRDGRKVDHSVKNLLTLCTPCHVRVHRSS